MISGPTRKELINDKHKKVTASFKHGSTHSRDLNLEKVLGKIRIYFYLLKVKKKKNTPTASNRWCIVKSQLERKTVPFLLSSLASSHRVLLELKRRRENRFENLLQVRYQNEASLKQVKPRISAIWPFKPKSSPHRKDAVVRASELKPAMPLCPS